MPKQSISITLQGETFPLRFTMEAWEKLEDEICTLDELEEQMQKKGRLRVIVQVAALLAQPDQPEVTPEYIFNAMEPRDVRRVTAAIMQAITDGLKMEEKQDEGEIHDVVLEEIEAKKERAV